jgi:hypothetical protein
LDLDGVDAGVEQVRGEGAPAVMGAEMADAGLAGPPVDEGIDGLGGEAPQRDPARLVDGAEEGPGLVEASDLEPGGHGPASPGRKGGAALAAALAGHSEVAGGRVVVVDVEGDGLGSP